VRLVDPAAARIAPVEDDLGDAALLLPLVLGEREDVIELLEQDLDDAFELALLCGRKMIEARVLIAAEK
jgi:hypothetical protein